MICNLHTHTVFCDGKNTAEEMVCSAISKGLKYLGFSGHSPIPVENTHCISYEDLSKYHEEVYRLKEKYKNEITIFLGLETEHIHPINRDIYDYTISSVHDMRKGDEIFSVDFNREMTADAIKRLYNSDHLEFVKAFYDCVIDASKYGEILGHFDLICKFNKRNNMFDEHSKQYIDIANNAIVECMKNGIIIEINTGAISRGYLDRFYPDEIFLPLMRDNNARISINSDSHEVSTIDCYYDESVEILKRYGFTKNTILTENGFESVKF